MMLHEGFTMRPAHEALLRASASTQEPGRESPLDAIVFTGGTFATCDSNDRSPEAVVAALIKKQESINLFEKVYSHVSRARS